MVPGSSSSVALPTLDIYPGQAEWPRQSQPFPVWRIVRALKWANLPAEAAQT